MGRRGWKVGIDVCTVLCMKQVAGEGLLYTTGKKNRIYNLFVGYIKLTLKCIPIYMRYRNTLSDPTYMRCLEKSNSESQKVHW